MNRILIIAAIVSLTGCTAADIFVSGRAELPPRRSEPIPERYPERHREVRVAGRSFIPPGHLPPPGACKIWTPGKPPGHQKSITSCDEAFYYVQPGQMVVRRDDYDQNVIEVSKAYVYRNALYFDVEHYLVK